jgi:CubicO group peptidase (beta-lactamase class C family)
MRPETPHLLQSVSKSMIGALAGCLVASGRLDVGRAVEDVVPELHGTSFVGCTVQDLLDMRAGTHFDENYDDPNADVRAYEQVYLWRPRSRGGALPATSYFATLRNDGRHGGPFRYRSILTDVLAWVLERAAEARLSELISRELWGPMGAEFDAEITLDAYGNPMADGGISATLRDLGRFGLQYLVSAAGPRAVPTAWVKDTIRGAPDGRWAFQSGLAGPERLSAVHYRNYWWIDDPEDGFLYAAGIYGQNVFVHPPTQTVVVKLSSWPTPTDAVKLMATKDAAVAIGQHLARADAT